MAKTQRKYDMEYKIQAPKSKLALGIYGLATFSH